MRLLTGSILLTLVVFPPFYAETKPDDFNSVVKMIERFYGVKHAGLPFLARAGIKSATTVARVAGGTKRRLAEAGSVKLAYFEDQDFGSGAQKDFRVLLNATMAPGWTPFLQVISKDQEQTYIFLRTAGEKFNVLVVTIEKRDATVVQVDLNPRTLALLMQDPDGMGKAITDDASTGDQE